MAIVSISEAAKLAQVARSTIYRHLNNGDLSATKQADGTRGIDTSELARVFGLLHLATSEAVAHETSRDSELLHQRIELLERENRLLKEENERAYGREKRLLSILETRLLSGPEKKTQTEKEISETLKLYFSPYKTKSYLK